MEAYKIGILHSRTGVMAASEMPLIDSALMAVDEINAGGGIMGRPVKALITDCESDPAVFERVALKFYRRGVRHLFGSWTSLTRKALKQVVEEKKMLLWYPLQYEGLESSPYIVYTGNCLNQQVEPAIRWLKNEGWKKVFLLGSDYIYPRTANYFARAILEMENLEVTGERYYDLGDFDFSSLLKSGMIEPQTAIFNTINGVSNLHFFRQYHEAGFTPEKNPVISMSVAENEVKQIGPSMRGHYACWGYFHSLGTPANRKFVRRFHQRYGKSRVSSDPVVAAYSQIYLFKKVVECAASFDVEVIRGCLPGTSFHSPAGLLKIQKNQHLKKRALLGRVNHDLGFDVVWRSELIEPLPWFGIEKGKMRNPGILYSLLEGFSEEFERFGRTDKMARELRESQNRFKALADSAMEGVCITERDKVIDCNKAFSDMFGYRHEELLGMKALDLAHSNSHSIMKKSAFSGEDMTIETHGLHAGGTTFPILMNTRPVNYLGRPAQVVTIIDLTEKNRTLAKLRESEQTMKSVMNNSSSLIFLKNPEGIFQFVNKAYERVFQITPGGAVGKRDHDIFDAEVANQFRENDLEVTFKREPIQFEEEARVNGKVHTYLVSKFPLFDLERNLVSVCGIATDITDRKEAESELRREKEKVQNYLDIAGVILIVINSQGVVEMINKKGCEVLGYDEEEIIGKNWFENFLPDSVKKQVLDHADNIINKKPEASQYFENLVVTKSGEERLIAWSNIKLYDEKGEVVAHLSSGEDITERKKLENKLLLAQKIIESTSDAIMVTDLSGKIIDINPAYTAITGYSKEEALGKNPRFSKSEKHNKDFFDLMWRSVLVTGSWSGEVWDIHKDGHLYPKLLSINTVYDDKGNPLVYTGIFSDISSLKEAEEKLHRIAYYDLLTGLPNRSMFLDRLSHEIAAYHRSGAGFALLFIDLDKFKNINDTLGHTAGDELLKEAASRIRSHLRELDTVARLGGDEFTVILSDTESQQKIAQIATMLIGILKKPFYIAGSEVYIGASIGISMCPRDGDTIGALTKYADMAMYHAKNNGRNTFSFFTEKLNEEVHKGIRLEKELRGALLHNEFILYYQPKISLADNKITGVEALIRWNHPDRGIVSPSEFISVAEETGLILPIGEWVIRTAVKKLSEWKRMKLDPVSISINLSLKQFCEKNFLTKILELARESGVNMQQVGFEITESMLMENPERSVKVMEEMKNNGINLAIDDFGTGYSSLSYLRQFPLDTLKIDQSFVRDIMTDPDDAAIVKTIISMAKSLGLAVVAEGVETKEQKDFLAKRRCQEGQGFLFAKPMPEEELVRLMGSFG